MNEQNKKIRIGISSCLLGEKVRYDGGHFRNKICVDQIDEWCEWVKTCPEMGMGMPTPRPTIRLMDRDGDVRLVDTKDSNVDHTQGMREFAAKQLPQFEGLSGYILAKNSPSCGMERVKVWSENGHPLHHKGMGLFAQMLAQKYPNLPLEESGRLNDDNLRDNFLARVFVYHEWLQLVQSGVSSKKLFDFHSRVKYALMACDVPAYQSLGRMLAQELKPDADLEQIAQEYISSLMQALTKVPNAGAHHNVLLHLMGYFKKQLSAVEKANLRASIDAYQLKQVPLGVPVSLIRLYLKQYPNDYLEKQFYLFPYPKKLATRDFLQG